MARPRRSRLLLLHLRRLLVRWASGGEDQPAAPPALPPGPPGAPAHWIAHIRAVNPRLLLPGGMTSAGGEQDQPPGLHRSGRAGAPDQDQAPPRAADATGSVDGHPARPAEADDPDAVPAAESGSRLSVRRLLRGLAGATPVRRPAGVARRPHAQLHAPLSDRLRSVLRAATREPAAPAPPPQDPRPVPPRRPSGAAGATEAHPPEPPLPAAAPQQCRPARLVYRSVATDLPVRRGAPAVSPDATRPGTTATPADPAVSGGAASPGAAASTTARRPDGAATRRAWASRPTPERADPQGAKVRTVDAPPPQPELAAGDDVVAAPPDRHPEARGTGDAWSEPPRAPARHTIRSGALLLPPWPSLPPSREVPADEGWRSELALAEHLRFLDREQRGS